MIEVKWTDDVSVVMDFALSVFFCIYFAVRYIAAEDKLKFVFSMECIVDYFTIPPVILSGIHKKYFIYGP